MFLNKKIKNEYLWKILKTPIMGLIIGPIKKYIKGTIIGPVIWPYYRPQLGALL